MTFIKMRYSVNSILKMLRNELPAMPFAGDIVKQDVILKDGEIYFEISNLHKDVGKKFRISIKEIK